MIIEPNRQIASHPPITTCIYWFLVETVYPGAHRYAVGSVAFSGGPRKDKVEKSPYPNNFSGFVFGTAVAKYLGRTLLQRINANRAKKKGGAMKNQILIIEDNYHKFFTTKQVLEIQMKLPVTSVEVHDGYQLVRETEACNPDFVMYCPGGIIEVISQLKKRNSNCRNSEVTLIYAEDIDEMSSRVLQDYLNGTGKNRGCKAA